MDPTDLTKHCKKIAVFKYHMLFVWEKSMDPFLLEKIGPRLVLEPSFTIKSEN